MALELAKRDRRTGIGTREARSGNRKDIGRTLRELPLLILSVITVGYHGWSRDRRTMFCVHERDICFLDLSELKIIDQRSEQVVQRPDVSYQCCHTVYMYKCQTTLLNVFLAYFIARIAGLRCAHSDSSVKL